MLGFIGRRNPDLPEDDRAGPKYLNTPETVLFHKGAQLFGTIPTLAADAIPVLVEGPTDAIAVTLATARPLPRPGAPRDRAHRTNRPGSWPACPAPTT